MRRYVRRGLAALLVITVLSAGAAIWFVHSGRFDLWLTHRLVLLGADYGARVEIESLQTDLSNLGLKIRGIRVYAGTAGDPIATVEELDATGVINNLWRQSFALKELKLVRPQVWVRFDKAGALNLSAFHDKPRRPGERTEGEKIRSKLMHAQIVDGRVYFNDAQHKIDGESDNLSFELTPGELASTQPNQITLTLKDAHVGYDNKLLDGSKLELAATFNETRADVQSFVIETPISRTTLHGEIPNLKDGTYRFDSTVEIDVAQGSKVFAPALNLTGKAIFKGQITGKGAEYKATGRLQSEEISSREFNASAFDLQGGLAGQGKTGLLDGQLAIGRLYLKKTEISRFRADITCDAETLTLKEFTAGVLGGAVKGGGEVHLSGDKSISLNAQVTGLSLARIGQLAARKSIPISGTASAKVQLSMNGFDTHTISGHVVSDFRGATRPAVENAQAEQFSGELAVSANAGRFTIERSSLLGADSLITATGTISESLVTDLQLDFKSKDLSVAQQLARDLGYLPRAFNDYQLVLNGPSSFVGKVTGKLSRPVVSGHLKLNEVQARGESVGGLDADIQASESKVLLKNGMLRRKDGAGIDFSVNAPLGQENAISATAKFQRIDIPLIAKFAVADPSQDLGLAGKLTGMLTLAGLPGRKVVIAGLQAPIGGISGQFSFETTGLQIKGEPIERASGAISLQDQTLTFKDLAISSDAAHLVLNGGVDTQSLKFDLAARADKISLDYIKSLSEKNGASFPATGTVNVALEAKGDLGDPRIKLAVSGQNIQIKDTRIDEPDLKVEIAEESKGPLTASAVINGQRRSATGSISITDDGVRVQAEESLAESALEPYLVLLGNWPAGTKTIATGKATIDTIVFPADELDKASLKFDLSSLKLNLPAATGDAYRLQSAGPVQVSATPKQVNFQQFHLIGEGTDLELKGMASVDPSTPNAFAATGELNLRALNPFIAQAGHGQLTTAGKAKGSLSVAGNNPALAYEGRIDVSDFMLDMPERRISITNGVGQVQFKSNLLQVQGFSARMGDGKLRIAGQSSLAGFKPDGFRFDLLGEGISLSYRPQAKDLADARLVLSGDSKSRELSGAIKVSASDYTRDLDVAELIVVPGSELARNLGLDLFGADLRLELEIRTHDSRDAQSRLAQLFGKGELLMQGAINGSPSARQAVLTEGKLNANGLQYRVVKAMSETTKAGEPYFDIEIETIHLGVRVTILLSGTASRLTVEPRAPTP